MTDVWDFSSLLDGWSRGKQPAPPNPEAFPDISDQMRQELDEIQSKLSSLNADPAAPPPHGLLVTPSPRLVVPVLAPETMSRVSVRTDLSSARSRAPTAPEAPHMPYEPRDNGPMETRSKRPFRARPVAPPNQPIFRASPNSLGVANFALATRYVMHFTLQNMSTRSRGFRIQAPKDPAFTFRVLEDVTTSVISPGLRLNFEIVFLPTEPRDYDESIVILAGDGVPPTPVTLKCYRDPPALELPDTVDLGETLVHSMKEGRFRITNNGGVAFFTVSSSDGREGSLVLVDGAFSLRPSQFELQPGESIDIDLKFRPIVKGEHTAKFEIHARHFRQKFHVVAKGFAAGPELRFGMCGEQRLFVPFLPQDANTTKEIEVINEADIAYPFHVQIMKPKSSEKSLLNLLYPDVDMQEMNCGRSAFVVSPSSGVVGPKGTMKISVTFSPMMFALYRANIVIFADRIPDATGTKRTKKMLTIAAEAAAGPPQVSVQPPLVIFSDVVPGIASHDTLDIVNDSYVNVKLQWAQSDSIMPSPDVVDITPKTTKSCNLRFLLDETIPRLQPQRSGIFRFLPKLDDGQSGVLMKVVQKQDVSRPPCQSYSFAFSPLTQNQVTLDNDMAPDFSSEEDVSEDEMPNIFKREQIPGPKDETIEIEAPVSEEHIPLDCGADAQISFAYAANLASPVISAEPPVLQFGYVLVGETGTQVLTLVNHFEKPVGYSITYPETGWSIEAPQGIIEDKVDIKVHLHFDYHLPVTSMITVETFWLDSQGNRMNATPTYVCDVPVYAFFGRPFLDVKERVLDMGEVLPTLVYKGSIHVSLMNTFPADFEIETGMTDEGEYTKASPGCGHLVQGETAEVAIEACFSKLGHRVLPFNCNVNGGTYTCAVCAYVVPPRVRLLTESVDFSRDFVICNRSHAKVVVANDCAVMSTVRLEMIDDCDGVFSLDSLEAKDLVDKAEFAVSCYSEIHGDYHGSLKVIFYDQWQTEEIVVPLHVKALGSFFGFQKHTLGYTPCLDGDYVSFGANIKQSENKVIRRLTLENFSSEPITVEWDLENLVPGRTYADLNIDVNFDGTVQVQVEENPDANLRDPFTILCDRSSVESHGKTVVVLEFVPRERGTFRGLVTARSGEFALTLGLLATVI